MPPLRNTGSVPEAECPEYAGHYLLESVLGTGGMGVVHLATSDSGLRLAVKVIHADYASDPEFRARFRQEVAAARTVSGAFTAPVVDADPDAERPWMATLFIEGPTLSDRVKRSGPLNTEELFRLGAGLAEGLRDIHRAGVVHRDLKPSNVLLAADGPKVIDFGISRPKDSDLRTETGKLIGTPPFMAPEQFQRPREVGPAADVFAMAAVLVHAATGRGPFDSESPYVVAYQVVHNEPDLTGVPEALVPLVHGCLAKDPALRPTPDEVMAALRPSSRGSTPYVPPRPDWRTGESSTADTHPRSSARAAAHPQSSESAPSRSYAAPDTQSRSSAAQDTHRPSSAEAGTRPPSSRRSLLARASRRPRVRWAAAGAVLALAAAGLLGAHAAGDASGRPSSVTGEARPFHAWETMLRADRSGNRTPACSASASAVYCTAPGVAAARLDPASGRVVWSVKDARTTDFVGSDTTPVLSDGLLYVVAPGSRRLDALDPASGKQRWSADISRYPTVRYTSRYVLLTAPNGRSVRALDGRTGAQRWARDLDTDGFIWTDPSGTDDNVYAAALTADGAATEVSLIDPATGSVSWTKRVTGGLTPVGTSEGALFLLSQNADGVADAVVEIRTAARDVRRFPLSEPVDQAQATLAGGVVYVMGYSGSLVAVDTSDPGTGRPKGQLWWLETAASRASRPMIAGDRVYIAAGDGRLLAVDARRGQLLAQTRPRIGRDRSSTVASTLPPPVALGGEVVSTAPDGSVFAVEDHDVAHW